MTTCTTPRALRGKLLMLCIGCFLTYPNNALLAEQPVATKLCTTTLAIAEEKGQPTKRCVALELYCKSSDADDVQKSAELQPWIKQRTGVTVRVFDIEKDSTALDR